MGPSAIFGRHLLPNDSSDGDALKRFEVEHFQGYLMICESIPLKTTLLWHIFLIINKITSRKLTFILRFIEFDEILDFFRLPWVAGYFDCSRKYSKKCLSCFTFLCWRTKTLNSCSRHCCAVSAENIWNFTLFLLKCSLRQQLLFERNNVKLISIFLKVVFAVDVGHRLFLLRLVGLGGSVRLRHFPLERLLYADQHRSRYRGALLASAGQIRQASRGSEWQFCSIFGCIFMFLIYLNLKLISLDWIWIV